MSNRNAHGRKPSNVSNLNTNDTSRSDQPDTSIINLVNTIDGDGNSSTNINQDMTNPTEIVTDCADIGYTSTILEKATHSNHTNKVNDETPNTDVTATQHVHPKSLYTNLHDLGFQIDVELYPNVTPLLENSSGTRSSKDNNSENTYKSIYPDLKKFVEGEVEAPAEAARKELTNNNNQNDAMKRSKFKNKKPRGGDVIVNTMHFLRSDLKKKPPR